MLLRTLGHVSCHCQIRRPEPTVEVWPPTCVSPCCSRTRSPLLVCHHQRCLDHNKEVNNIEMTFPTVGLLLNSNPHAKPTRMAGRHRWTSTRRRRTLRPPWRSMDGSRPLVFLFMGKYCLTQRSLSSATTCTYIHFSYFISRLLTQCLQKFPAMTRRSGASSSSIFVPASSSLSRATWAPFEWACGVSATTKCSGAGE